jgi:PAS domain S-box-containing protein
MNPSIRFDADGDRSFRVLWEDGDRIFCRGHRSSADGDRDTVLAVLPATEHPTPAALDRLAHEYGLKDELDVAWAVRPLELVRERGRTMLVLEDPGSEPLERLLSKPLELGSFLHFAIGIASALGKAHRRGLVHKDIKPANILVNQTTGEVRLTGFGIASRLLRERPAPEPPETIAGTLAYMAPEQTGRMNRSIDARSDLYALGVTFYQMLTGALPFSASDPMDWVHCHIARKPVPPAERLETIPAPVSAIILKLLAKTAEERYQTAAGVASDLRGCLAEWEARRRIDDFPLGQQDTPDRLLIPEKLYGREREIETLLAAFDRIIKSGTPELVLLSGYSGIGKSAVVHELHRVLVPPRGLFAAGKFDQYKRDIPYATLAQAFQSLVRPLLGRSETELSGWRDAFLEALGPNGRLMTDFISELKLIIGEQPAVPELPPQDTHRRFQLVFRRFIGVFARPEHPLALFLDDLQWLDAATLDLIEDILSRSDLQHLMLIGAYRDNEVDAAHPLKRKLDAIGAAGGKVSEVRLAPLAREHLGRLIADALRCEPKRAASLAQLLHEKTGGNPFFAIQFVTSLAEEGMLVFDHDAARWSWDLDGIHAKGYTDNVVDLMVAKLTRLPADAQNALRLLACLGNSADSATLSIVLGTSEEGVHPALWPAAHQELVERLAHAYRFAHDRVQEAAYSLIPTDLRSASHLRIGRLLVSHIPHEKRHEAIFEIVNQLNRGAALITARDEKKQLAELNLIAGKRAKASTAYVSALSYLVAGTSLLADDGWEQRPDIKFALELHRGECEFLTGELAAAEERLTTLSSRALAPLDQATVASLRIDLYTTLDRMDRAVEVCLAYLRHLGIEWSAHPTEEEARREFERTWSLLGHREIEELIDLPLMDNSEYVATLDVVIKVMTAALNIDANLHSLLICWMVNFSLEHGNTDASCSAYIQVGAIAGPRFGNYKAGFRFGQLGYNLVERRGLKRFQARIYLGFAALILPWAKHVRTGRDLFRRGRDSANTVGDLTYAAYACSNVMAILLAAGDPLPDVHREAERGLEFVLKARYGSLIDIMTTHLVLVRTLRGFTATFGCFNDARFDERRFERQLASSAPIVACWYWTRKLQARFFAGDCAAAVDASVNAQRLLWTSPAFFEAAEAHFYGALSHAASCDVALPTEYQQHVRALATHYRQLAKWAENCPENFGNRAALVGAEIARIEGRELDAERLYDQAIRSARENGFVHNEALAYELAARFYAARGFDEIAHLYLKNARYGYLRWGADGKVRQLDEVYPILREEQRAPSATSTIGAQVEHLDLATVINVSQAVSSEMILDKLIETLMRTAMVQAGAERALLILARENVQGIAAEAVTRGDTVIVHLRTAPAAEAALPASVFQYVLRTRESVILDDATGHSPFSADPYIRQRQARSILCLPLLNQAKLIGVLYLENNLAPRVFAPARLAVLKLLASQAAIALENTRLYRDLLEREAKIRRLVDANIIGILISSRKGEIIEANDAFLKMVGYDRDDLAAGRVRWTDLTPPEWRDRTSRAWTEIEMTGAAQPFEKEYFRKDGSRVPVLVGSAAFDEQRDQGVTFVLDLTERKHVEQALRDMQTNLAHVVRITTLGELTASIAHEVNQPLGAVLANAEACLRWLRRATPDLDAACRSVEWIIDDGNRASEVIRRVRALAQKTEIEKVPLDVNDVVREVVALVQRELTRHQASLRMEFAPALPMVLADRVQLQQVIINLVINGIEAMQSVTDRPRELVIRSGQDEPHQVLVSVTDCGVGITAENADRVFNAFFTTKSSGMGMGLSICRSIMEAHGGRLWATANIAHGATFRFTLPVNADTAS